MKYLILFIQCVIVLWANAQTVTKMDRDKINEGQCCSPAQMEKAWYAKNATDTSIPIKYLGTNFSIVVDTNAKANNFISDHENHLRSQSLKLDTSVFRLMYVDKWTKLTIKEKQEFMAKQMVLAKQQADSIHVANNEAKTQIWLINNTDSNVSIPMQDFSYICVLQAFTKSGQWVSIENWRFSWCGNSYYDKVFKPKTANFFICTLPTKGDFQTKLRFKLVGVDKFYYSNEFTAKINSSNFINKEQPLVKH